MGLRNLMISKYGECGAMTTCLIIALILGSIGFLLMHLLIIGLIPAIIMLGISSIFMIISLIILIRLINRVRKERGSIVNGFYSLSGWCKFNCIFFVVALCVIIGEIIALSIKNK